MSIVSDIPKYRRASPRNWLIIALIFFLFSAYFLDSSELTSVVVPSEFSDSFRFFFRNYSLSLSELSEDDKSETSKRGLMRYFVIAISCFVFTYSSPSTIFSWIRCRTYCPSRAYALSKFRYSNIKLVDLSAGPRFPSRQPVWAIASESRMVSPRKSFWKK